ncbi:unnamed protein product [Parajaminaea phylloscopi]
MSHFVSSTSGQGFEELNQQLLRREPVDEGKEEAEEAISAQEQRRQPADAAFLEATPTSGRVPSLAARRLETLAAEGPGSITSRPSTPSSLREPAQIRGSPSARSPSYSRKNSPERVDRPRSPRPLRTPATSIHEDSRDDSLVTKVSRSVSNNQPQADTAGPSRQSTQLQEAISMPSKLIVEAGGKIRRPRENRNVAFSVEGGSVLSAAAHPEHPQPLSGTSSPALSGASWDRTRSSHSVQSKRNTGMLDPVDVPRKLGTWDGVFVPVSLNILGIILFLRFGFILGQAGLIGSLALLVVSYAIDALTSTSISAISTNGVVRAGGIFYLASRSLGPEFGGATGLLFWLGQSLNASLNALGFVETLTDAFGQSREGASSHGLPEGPWWSLFYGSFVLLLSTVICLVGSRLFVRATMLLAVVLCVAIASIPLSTLLVSPFTDEDRGIFYTSWSLATLQGNLWPHFTRGAAGSSASDAQETWSSVFGVLFPAATGILAGASMSGDLRKPSKSIPKGTHWSLLCTFVIYAVVFVILAGTTARTSFYLDIGVMSDISAAPFVITLGALASTAFSSLMGIQACGKVLQAIARDNLLPVLDTFAQGTEFADTPTYGIVATYIFCQIVLFVDSVNIIAQLVTMTSLLCFAVLSFACLALKAGGAPSFRPSFPYFSIYTAAAGAVCSLVAMFFTDGTVASGCILLAIVLFGAIHVFSPPKPWGDVTRNIHYWLTRKYLLRLDERKTNLKHWRPQVLLLANNPRSEWNLIIFCNSLKKGGLYILGHCIKGEFGECLSELRKQQIAWLKLVDLSGIKSFVDVVIANDEREGARSLILSAGLGGMRPNIVVLGFPRDLQALARAGGRAMRKDQSVSAKSDSSQITIRGPHVAKSQAASKSGVHVDALPTDATRKEAPITAQAYVGIIEDALALNKAVAIAYGFDMLQLPGPSSSAHYEKSSHKQYIDLWPIQIASPDSDTEHAWDTYTMVLQLGTILSLTGTWKSHQLRVSVFVEEPSEVIEEQKRVRSLLDNLRIPASLRVFCLADGTVASYEAIVLGQRAASPHVEEALRSDPWWITLKQLRREEEVRAKAAEAKRRLELQQQQATATDIPGAGSSGNAVGSAGSGSQGARQNKREQRLLGYSLPPDHIEYFKRNIRIGLSHPRAKPRNDGTDVEDGEDSDSDSNGSGLSDELLRLSEDDFFAASSSAESRGLVRVSRSAGKGSTARSRSFSSVAYSGLPDEPGLRPAIEQSGPSTPSYGSMANTPVVRPDGTVLMPGGRSHSRDSTLKASDRSNLGALDGPRGGQNDFEESQRTPLARTFRRRKRGDSDSVTRSNASSRRTSPSPMPRDGEAFSRAETRLSFNTLPNKAQFIILNELFRAHSSSSATSVILTSLPAPEPGTAKDHEAVSRYLSQLEVLCAGSTPVLGIHARELTLSMSL